MAQTPFSIIDRRAGAMRAAATLLLVLCAGLAAGADRAVAEGAHSTSSPGANLPMAELERAFWVCDHAATIGRVDSGTAITCGALTEMFKQRRFNGDFNALLAWWQLNKEAEHLALANASGRNALARLLESTR